MTRKEEMGDEDYHSQGIVPGRQVLCTRRTGVGSDDWREDPTGVTGTNTASLLRDLSVRFDDRGPPVDEYRSRPCGRTPEDYSLPHSRRVKGGRKGRNQEFGSSHVLLVNHPL